MEYVDEEKAIENIPTLRMLLQKPEVIRKRANILAGKLKKQVPGAGIKVVTDTSRAGGGSLPEMDLPTYAISIKPLNITVNELEEKLRKGSPPVIARIKDDSLLFDARTLQEKDFGDILLRISSIIE